MEANHQSLSKLRRGTQLIFLVCGLGISSWAPMVPYVKDRLGLNESQLGLLLLFLGAGALITMPVTGMLIHKYGSRIAITISTLSMAILLPVLLLVNAVPLMALCLFLFGAAVGAVDVAMNSHAVHVQNMYGRKIMSSLHGLFSIGGLVGPLLMGLLIDKGLTPFSACLGITILLILISFSQYSSLLDAHAEKGVVVKHSTSTVAQAGNGSSSWFHGSVIFVGLLCFSAFLAEGAMLDWSAVYLRDVKKMLPEYSGAGYAAFSVAMAIMRLSGDRLIERLGSRVIVSGGGVIAATGLVIAIMSTAIWGVLAGFILLGIGAANMVPVFFTDGGNLPGVRASIAIPAITTIGYLGQLAGPAALGFIAHKVSLSAAFGCSAALFFMITIAYLLRHKVART